ncbi:antibiotic biosynthesis monooxygenase [Leptolyngbya sp. 'hensonii']|uniref:antibiotic biosynthesis monooxygenase n=1 Tax=Leptolyngbya sp. 'hensonii' TaxID=1922337 RepID=UPI00094FC85E|nr:antibiotic biosynthesis monooxygenase [Leptolyngbya sp. 'hensonii']OLP17152.1 antibiotic biosynthesis monooxygenase [Leptolyngbya sp. 'hensonii']
MDQPYSQSDPITLVISEIVHPDRIPEYEAWTQGINQAVQQFEGFLGAELFRPRDHDYPEYVVILKFDTYENFRTWTTSAVYRDWMEKSRGLVTVRSRQQFLSGMELWFTLPSALKSSAQPAYYKKVIIGILSVYPLIVLSNLLLGPLLAGLPPLLGLLISVSLVSALLTYPVMPWLTQWLEFWLYPSVTKRHNRVDNGHRSP